MRPQLCITILPELVARYLGANSTHVGPKVLGSLGLEERLRNMIHEPLLRHALVHLSLRTKCCKSGLDRSLCVPLRRGWWWTNTLCLSNLGTILSLRLVLLPCILALNLLQSLGVRIQGG